MTIDPRGIDVPKWLDAFLKIPTRMWLVIAGTAALPLFSPDTFMATMGLEGLRREHRWIFSVAFLASLGLVVSSVLAFVATKVSNLVKIRKARKAIGGLSPDLKGTLYRFLKYDQSVVYVSIERLGRARVLAARGYITQASETITVDGIQFYMLPWVWDYLKAHPEVLADAPEAKKDAAKGIPSPGRV